VFLAHYMFINFGWRPQQVADLPHRERLLMFEMAYRETKQRAGEERQVT
jgi:hypothetical protein